MSFTISDKIKYASLIFCVLIASLFLYQKSLGFYFFQDDFFLINMVSDEKFIDISETFKFRNDIIGYRPVTINLYFTLARSIFGLNPLGFHLISFTAFFLCFLMIFKLISKITKNLKIGFLTATFWILSSIHFMSLTWISASYPIFGTLFWVISAILFLKYLETRKIIYYMITITSFLVTVGSFEFAITWPPIMFCYYLLTYKSLKKGVLLLAPFGLISFIYLLLRSIYIKIPDIPEYLFIVNFEAFRTFFWYILWSLNIPEEFKKQAVKNLIYLNKTFQLDYWPLIAQTFLGGLSILTLTFAMPLYKALRGKLKLNFNIIFLSVAWFSLGILPVIFLPNHNFLYYLTLPSIGIYLLLSYFLVKQGKNIFIAIVIIIWFSTSASVVKFYYNNSWMLEAQKFAKEFIVNLNSQTANFPKNSIFLYSIADKRHLQAISPDNAFRLVYTDSSYKIYYNKKDLFNAAKNRTSDQYIFVFQPFE